MDFNETSVHLAVSQEPSPRATPSPPAISASGMEGSENDPIIEDNESGVLRARGRRRRPGRARVRMQDNPNSEPNTSNNKGEESGEFLQPHSLRFSESPSPTPSKIGSARGSFRHLVTKVSQKIQPTKKQGKQRLYVTCIMAQNTI